MNDKQLRAANALSLRWHAGASTVGYDTFRPWALAALKAELPFDGAIWGLLSPGGGSIVGAHLQALDDGALQALPDLPLNALCSEQPPGAAAGACFAEARWQDAAHEALQAQVARHGLVNVLVSRFVESTAHGQQFVLLSRKAPTHRFGDDETALFGWLAPHLMQAFATRRRIHLDKAAGSGQALAAVAVALVDRSGFVHDQHANFAAMLRREWTDWSGRRLPDPLLEIVSRRTASLRRFVGAQMSIELLPVDDFYVASVRARQRSDGLTEREGDVAQRYAAGGSFREVAESLNVAPATVRAHLRNVFGKLQIRNKAQLAAALRHGA